MLSLLPLSAFTHYLIFPQESKSILIDFSNFEKDGRLYFKPNTPQNTIDTLKNLIQQASLRIDSFWGTKTGNPKFIYCDTDEDFKKYGTTKHVPAATQLKLGSYIIISKEGIDLDIIAHEMAHAAFFEQVGFYKRRFVIPTWFDEGLAMQVDYRACYSENSFKRETNNCKNVPDVTQLTTGTQFYEGTLEQIMLNYSTAKHEVKNWYSKEKLEKSKRRSPKGRSHGNIK